MSKLPPTIEDFRPGTAHTVGRVAALFGVSRYSVHRWIKTGRLKAGTPCGTNLLLIPGEEVRRAWKEAGFDPDPVIPLPPPTEAERKREAERALRDLERLEKLEKRQMKK